jgi:hypothetical protein
MEKKYATGITEELRGKFGLDLDKEPLVDRSIGPQCRPKRKVDILLVGSNSTASKLATSMRARGKTVDVLASSWLTVTRTSMEQLAAQTRKAIHDEDPDLVILQVLENSCFYVKQEDGSRQLPKKGPDEVFHIEGEVQVCTRETQLEHFYTLRPLLDAVGKKKTLLMAPLPRYITSGCCTDRGHTTNRQDPYYKENMYIVHAARGPEAESEGPRVQPQQKKHQGDGPKHGSARTGPHRSMGGEPNHPLGHGGQQAVGRPHADGQPPGGQSPHQHKRKRKRSWRTEQRTWK